MARGCAAYYSLDDGTFDPSEIGLGSKTWKSSLQLRQVLQNVQRMLTEPKLDLEELNIEAKVAYADAALFAEKVNEWMAAGDTFASYAQRCHEDDF